ncbi:MAG: GumC family protein [Verrucomicrobiales bacterium]
MTTTELESPKTEQLTVRPVAQPSPNVTGAPHPHPYPPMQPIILAAPGGNAPYTIAMPGSAAEPPRQIVSLEEVFAWVARRWKLGAVCGALLAAAVLVFMLGRTPFYSSSASLIVRAREEKVFGFDPVVDNTLENHSAPFILNNHRAEMQTRKFREFLYGYLPEDIRAAFLAEPENPPIVSRSIAFAKKLVKGERDLSDEAVRKDAFVMALEDRAAVDFVKETYIINVAITHHDQALAPRLANAYIDAYLKYAADQDQETNREASAFLRRQADELARKVEHSEQELADYRKKEGLVQDDARQDLSAEKMKVLNGELTRAELDLSKVRRTLAQVAEAGGDTEALLSIDAIAAAPGIGALRAQLTDKLREKAAVDARYGELHPKHTEFYQGFNTLVAETRTAIGRVVGEHENRAAALEREVASLAGSLASTEDAVLDQGDRSVHLRMLQRQLDTDRELYNKISVRLNEASVSSEFGESRSLRQVDVAAPAEKPTRPNKPAAVLLSGFSFAAMFVGLPIALGGLETFRRLREKVGGAGESDPAAEGASATRRDTPDASLPALQAPHPGAAMLAKAPGSGEATALLAAPSSSGQPHASPTPGRRCRERHASISSRIWAS